MWSRAISRLQTRVWQSRYYTTRPFSGSNTPTHEKDAFEKLSNSSITLFHVMTCVGGFAFGSAVILLDKTYPTPTRGRPQSA